MDTWRLFLFLPFPSRLLFRRREGGSYLRSLWVTAARCVVRRMATNIPCLPDLSRTTFAEQILPCSPESKCVERRMRTVREVASGVCGQLPSPGTGLGRNAGPALGVSTS